jgi:hypothetical protein
VTKQPYEVDLTRTARRAPSERLPLDVAIGASDFIDGPLSENPHRVGKNSIHRSTASTQQADAGMAHPVRH